VLLRNSLAEVWMASLCVTLARLVGGDAGVLGHTLPCRLAFTWVENALAADMPDFRRCQWISPHKRVRVRRPAFQHGFGARSRWDY
jgi:hypothetical protein